MIIYLLYRQMLAVAG